MVITESGTARFHVLTRFAIQPPAGPFLNIKKEGERVTREQGEKEREKEKKREREREREKGERERERERERDVC